MPAALAAFKASKHFNSNFNVNLEYFNSNLKANFKRFKSNFDVNLKHFDSDFNLGLKPFDPNFQHPFRFQGTIQVSRNKTKQLNSKINSIKRKIYLNFNSNPPQLIKYQFNSNFKASHSSFKSFHSNSDLRNFSLGFRFCNSESKKKKFPMSKFTIQISIQVIITLLIKTITVAKTSA